jgi:YHS domain-containing protein
MKHRGLVTALLLGFWLVSSVSAQESKMGMDQKMKKESTMEKDSKMQKDQKMKKESTMEKDSKMQMDSKMHEGSMMKEVALHEYCPVAYSAAGKALKGNAMYSSTYKGKTYYFVGADIKKMFDASPTKYLPKYDGYCATAMAVGKWVESDPEIFTVHKGNTYLFSNKEAKAAFDSDPDETIAKAGKYFAAKAKM